MSCLTAPATWMAPPKVLIDYRIIRETRAGWRDVLFRYGVRTVILDRYRQTTLHRFLRDSDEWQVLYQDELGLVFGRTDRRRTAGQNDEGTEQGLKADE